MKKLAALLLTALFLCACGGNVEDKINGVWTNGTVDMIVNAKNRTITFDAGKEMQKYGIKPGSMGPFSDLVHVTMKYTPVKTSGDSMQFSVELKGIVQGNQLIRIDGDTLYYYSEGPDKAALKMTRAK